MTIRNGVSKAFLDAMSSKIEISSLSFFGFIGKNPSFGGCSIAKVGTVYQELAEATSGQTFDICEQDWSANFDKLAESIIETIHSTYDVNENIELIKSISIGGEIINAGDYSFNGKTVKLKEGVVPDGDLEIVIDYVPK